MPQNQRKSNVDSWLKKATTRQRKALETASKYFDKGDSLTVNTLEAIYGQESGFGSNRRSRGIKGAAGDMQFEKATAIRVGLKVSKKNDERFDIAKAARATARYLKQLDASFSKETSLGPNIKTISIQDADERKKFVLASINGGEGRIAQAQKQTFTAGRNPAKWDDVKEYLKIAGATVSKVKEIGEYVTALGRYEEEFSRKSPADKTWKDRPSPLETGSELDGGHWITKDGKHIYIEN
ncbi:MAG: transglycosylase SLT domain-containing protein [Deltaproteobacteria bacterium]|nr:transglycosylase SLT domain-containing protein [Deltaproteobacteria bacterium]